MGRTPCCDEQGLRKGFWTEEEDEKLLSYIKQHGEQHWNSLPRKAGLKRCGKSCRLRWTNYLKPGINRGNFTPEEEQLIIQLHAVLGSKWSAIARHLHKRTDNEVKNYWNTRIRRRLKEKGSDPTSTTTNTLAGTLANNSMYSENIANISTVVNHDGMYNSLGNKSDGGDGADNNQDTNSSNSRASVCETSSDATGADSNNVTILSSPVSTLSSSAHILNKVATTLKSRLHCLNAIKEIFSDELNKMATKIALTNQSEPLIQGTGAGNSHEPPVVASISGSYNIQTPPRMESLLSPFYEQYTESDSHETFFEEIAKALED